MALSLAPSLLSSLPPSLLPLASGYQTIDKVVPKKLKFLQQSHDGEKERLEVLYHPKEELVSQEEIS